MVENAPESQPPELADKTPEEQVNVLRGQLDALMLAGNAVARQLRVNGRHQQSFYGHFHDRCATCVVAGRYEKTAKDTQSTLAQMFPSAEHTALPEQ